MIDIKAIREAAGGFKADVWNTTIVELCDEVERLRDKLEVSDKSKLDGIDCRDETSRLQDEVERLRTALRLIEWSNDSSIQAQAATEALKRKPE